MAHGRVVLQLEDGSEVVFKGSGNRPRKCDVEVINVEPVAC